MNQATNTSLDQTMRPVCRHLMRERYFVETATTGQRLDSAWGMRRPT